MVNPLNHNPSNGPSRNNGSQSMTSLTASSLTARVLTLADATELIIKAMPLAASFLATLKNCPAHYTISAGKNISEALPETHLYKKNGKNIEGPYIIFGSPEQEDGNLDYVIFRLNPDSLSIELWSEDPRSKYQHTLEGHELESALNAVANDEQSDLVDFFSDWINRSYPDFQAAYPTTSSDIKLIGLSEPEGDYPAAVFPVVSCQAGPVCYFDYESGNTMPASIREPFISLPKLLTMPSPPINLLKENILAISPDKFLVFADNIVSEFLKALYQCSYQERGAEVFDGVPLERIAVTGDIGLYLRALQREYVKFSSDTEWMSNPHQHLVSNYNSYYRLVKEILNEKTPAIIKEEKRISMFSMLSLEDIHTIPQTLEELLNLDTFPECKLDLKKYPLIDVHALSSNREPFFRRWPEQFL